MAVFRIAKRIEKPFVMVDKGCVLDPRLSAKAKGILLYLLSRPDDWQVYEKEIKRHFTDGLRSIRSGILELIKHGYIERHQLRDAHNRFAGYEYLVYEVSKIPVMPFCDNGKQHPTNIDLTNTEILYLTPNELSRIESKRIAYLEWLDILKEQTGAIN